MSYVLSVPAAAAEFFPGQGEPSSGSKADLVLMVLQDIWQINKMVHGASSFYLFCVTVVYGYTIKLIFGNQSLSNTQTWTDSQDVKCWNLVIPPLIIFAESKATSIEIFLSLNERGRRNYKLTLSC